MIKKIFLLGFVLLAAGQLFAQSIQLITVSADGGKTTYALSEVQRIVFDTGNNTMTLNLKAGSTETNIKSVIFKGATGIITPELETSLFVFPNPVQEMLTVSGLAAGAKINLIDINGRLLKTVISQENATDIDVSSLQQGFYLLRVGKQVIKFIKK